MLYIYIYIRRTYDGCYTYVRHLSYGCITSLQNAKGSGIDRNYVDKFVDDINNFVLSMVGINPQEGKPWNILHSE